MTLKRDMTGLAPLEDLSLKPTPEDKVLAFMAEMEFNKLSERVAAKFGIDAPNIEGRVKKRAGGEVDGKPNLKGPNESSGDEQTSLMDDGAGDVAAISLAAMRKVPFDVRGYDTIRDTAALEMWVAAACEQGYVAIDTETTGLDAMSVDLVGVSLAIEPGKACYIPLQHKASDGLDFEGGAIEQIALDQAIALLKPMLEDPAVLKIGQNLKYDMVVLARYGVHLAPLDDTMLMSYVLDAGLHGHGMDELSGVYLDYEPISIKSLLGTGKSQITFDLVPVDEAAQYAAEDADVTLRLWRCLKPRLVEAKRVTVYETLERVLVPVLVGMEMAGVKVERAKLAQLSQNFSERLGELERDIHKLTGVEFNLASPKQLGEVLFDTLDYNGGKKTKSGAWGTGAGVLEQLAVDETLSEEERLLPRKILEWRQLAKLKSTYTDTLPNFINEATGRVHTSYSLAATTTGRLASTDPNLQNIPVRTQEGREIRTAFVAEKGNLLISADYSQIELRILAHMADIDQLIQAFHDGLDIHAMTASEMFGVPLNEMDPMTRRRAKAINFGIIYGISAFGLANQLGISRSEAGDYIKTYFKRFPGIRDYMEAMKSQVQMDGYVETLFGRRVHYPGINSSNRQQKAFVERAAINAPIQGTAADIIRRAMVRVGRELETAAFNTQMLLQVHDELIFEAPKNQADDVAAFVVKIMEGAAAPVVDLKVPLKVDQRSALNWDEAH